MSINALIFLLNSQAVPPAHDWCKIWGFHGDKDSGQVLLGCDAV